MALVVLLAFGSAATFLFWAKWLGKLSGIAGAPENVEGTVHRSEWAAGMLMAVLAVLGCVCLPIVSWLVVEPYVASVYGVAGRGISDGNLWIASIAAALVVIVLFAGLGRTKARQVDVYLAGVGRDNAGRTFQNSLSGERAGHGAQLVHGRRLRREAHRARRARVACSLVIVVAFAVSAVTRAGAVLGRA